jgi:hypothetical protein
MKTGQNQIPWISVKSILFPVAGIFAIAAAVLVIWFTSAATSTGGTPTQAITLGDEMTTGLLPPGQQRWFKFTGDIDGEAGRVQKSFTMIFTPDDGNRVRQVNFQLYEGNEAQYFNPDGSNHITNFGAGAVVSRDSNPVTGEFVWNGWLNGSDTYYLQVTNGSELTIDYWLFPKDIIHVPLGEPVVPQDVPLPEMGAAPSNPEFLAPDLTTGKLAPHSIYWYAFANSDFTSESRIQSRDLSMFFTPDDGNRQHHINFEIYPLSEIQIWERGDRDKLTNLGAGMLVSRDGDPNTGERIWRGSIARGETYLLAVENGSEVEIDYWIFNGDIYRPELGPKPTPELPPVFAQGASPSTAFPLQLGVNKGGLEPGKEIWYSFRLTDFLDAGFDEMALTMITTPDDGRRIHHMVFEVFTAGGAQNWSPGDNSRISNVGAGGIVERDDNPVTGERFWKGWVVENDLYYVQIRNGADVRMDYWLFTGDVFRPELTDISSPLPDAVTLQATATAGSPTPLPVALTLGHLEPQEERWYSFSRADANEAAQYIETAFNVVMSAKDKSASDKIDVEILASNDPAGDVTAPEANLTQIGETRSVEHVANPHINEVQWQGQVTAGDVHYVRISNDSDAAVDYQILPEEIINANLE